MLHFSDLPYPQGLSLAVCVLTKKLAATAAAASRGQALRRCDAPQSHASQTTLCAAYQVAKESPLLHVGRNRNVH